MLCMSFGALAFHGPLPRTYEEQAQGANVHACSALRAVAALAGAPRRRTCKRALAAVRVRSSSPALRTDPAMS